MNDLKAQEGHLNTSAYTNIPKKYKSVAKKPVSVLEYIKRWNSGNKKS